jgi:hypothetical protein
MSRHAPLGCGSRRDRPWFSGVNGICAQYVRFWSIRELRYQFAVLLSLSWT